MSLLKIVIVEDEVNNVLLIKELLKKISFPIEVVGVSAEVNDAVDLIKESIPDLVLLDIIIKGGTSFNVLEQLGSYDFEIIFITAHNQFAIDAIKKQALDYILKPINSEEFITAINHCKSKIDKKKNANQNISSDLTQYFTIKTHSGSEIILIDSILYFIADGSYTKCITDKSQHVISKNIGDIEKELTSNSFFRCHHSYIINKNHIQKVEISRSGSIICTDGKIIPVSQRKKKEFVEFLEKH